MTDTNDKTHLINKRIHLIDGINENNVEHYCSTLNYYIPARYVIAIWGFLGFTVVYTLRVNLSVALLEMVNNTAIPKDNESYGSECPKSNNTPALHNGKFVWNQQTQGFILGAFFWGYIPLQVPAGWIAVKIGGKWLFGIGVLWTSVLTLLTPLCAEWGVGWLIGLRILEGAGEVFNYFNINFRYCCKSITYPGMNAMLGYWAPVMETTFISGIVYSGSYAGLVVGLLGSGLLIEANIMGGWPSVFYIPGIIGVVWFVIWSLVAYSNPSKHPRISDREKRFIEMSIDLSGKNICKTVPWKQIFFSLPVWAISVTNFCAMWSIYTMLTCLPQYFEYILNFSIAQNGMLNALPYFLSAIAYIIFGKLADIIRSRGWLSTTATRKVFTTTGMVINSVFIIAMSYVGCNNVLVVVCLCLGVALGSMNNAGYLVNHIDIAPQYGGVLLGITNSIATLSGILGPYLVGALTNHNQTRDRWKVIFYISSGITMFGAIFYLLFGTGKRQSWAIDEKEIEVD